ncbi:charged multivesicular body protein 2a isoform X2 [Agelaius tricolor]|uniref:charged multivesicular body protein 2a isoform X2 n=1 Tax=Agelaius tricolor TaxID=9191 RepID=UPI0039F181BC
MELLFGRRRSPEELLRQNQRALSRAVRELERERQKLEAQEKKIIVDIKKMAKQGQMDAVRVLAKDLVRTRRYERKFIAMRANVQGVALRVQTLRSHSAMATAMRGVTRAMATMNRQLKLPQIQRILLEFQKQSELMDMKEELMNDAIDDALGDEDDEDESDAVVSQFIPVYPSLSQSLPVYPSFSLPAVTLSCPSLSQSLPVPPSPSQFVPVYPSFSLPAVTLSCPSLSQFIPVCPSPSQSLPVPPSISQSIPVHPILSLQ